MGGVPRVPLNATEAAICGRFYDARKRVGISRVALAASVGIDSSKLVNYEHARTQIPYSVGAKLAENLDACQRWLSTGLAPKSPFVAVDETYELAIPAGTLFSKVCEKVLNEKVLKVLLQHSQVQGRPLEEIRPDVLWRPDPIGCPPSLLGWQEWEEDMHAALSSVRGLDADQRNKLAEEIRALLYAHFTATVGEKSFVNRLQAEHAAAMCEVRDLLRRD